MKPDFRKGQRVAFCRTDGAVPWNSSGTIAAVARERHNANKATRLYAVSFDERPDLLIWIDQEELVWIDRLADGTVDARRARGVAEAGAAT